MASLTCNREINAQLQALQSRVKELENEVATINQTNIYNMIKLIAFAIANGSTAPLGAALAADPNIANFVLGISGWQAIMDAFPALDFKDFFLEKALSSLDIEPYGAAQIASATAAINASKTAADAALAAAIAGGIPAEIAAAQAKVNALQNAIDSLITMVSASNRTSKCKSKSAVIGL